MPLGRMRERPKDETEARALSGGLATPPSTAARSGPTPTPRSHPRHHHDVPLLDRCQEQARGDLTHRCVKGNHPAAEVREANKRGVLGRQSSGTWIGCFLRLGDQAEAYPREFTPRGSDLILHL